ncbi:hypothetical protein UP10_38620 [Bradyrhizobium sp. LTSPM299]|nr:hypothetical protein UP10_38620 [Bradyrhizobium sp. LTSPM299]
MAIFGLYRHNEVAAFFTRYPDLPNAVREKVPLASRELRKSGLSAPQPQDESNPTNAADAAQLQQVTETPDMKARQTSKNDERLNLLTNELAEARRTMDGANLQVRAELAKVQSLEQERDQTAALLKQSAAAQQQLAATADQSRSALIAEQARVAALTDELAAVRRDLESKTAETSKANDDVKQLKQMAETEAAELRQSLQRDKTTAAAQQQLAATAEQFRSALEAEQARGAALMDELAAVRRDLESKTAETSKANDDVKQLKQMAEAEAAELRQSLQQERDKTTAVGPQQQTSTAEQFRSALEAEQARGAALTDELAALRRDLESKTADTSKANNDMKQLKQMAEAEAAELRQSLQQERDNASALARDLNTTRRELAARTGSDRLTSSQGVQAKPITDLAAAESQEVQESPEATKLLARARALLTQGDIGAARIVLERAVEAGSARASFALAETYDPNILTSWGTYGTRGDASKADELYAKATAGGVREAKSRSDALRK